ncbi:MAG: hypothetical protein H6737_31860 [Alphaproteobacteria bacterium]|nr:hypothetical protein [Alphaproteobacteria bacterium]
MSRTFPGLALLSLALVACAPAPSASEYDGEDGYTYGGGELTVTFAVDEGDGVEGSFTLPGSSLAAIEADALVTSTGLWSGRWVTPEWDHVKYDLSIEPDGTVDLSGLSSTFRCDIDLDGVELLLRDQHHSPDLGSNNVVSFGISNAYQARSAERWRSPNREVLTESGTLVTELEWWSLGTYCPEDDDLLVGRGTVTVTWDFTEVGDGHL